MFHAEIGDWEYSEGGELKMGRSKWQNVGGFFNKVKSKAAKTMRSFKKDKPGIMFRLKRMRGRWRPWGPKSMGWQIQFKRKFKRKKR